MKTPEFAGLVITLLIYLGMSVLSEQYADPSKWFFWGGITGIICYKIWRISETI